MPLSIGIVGLPNVGKSTLFQTITKKQVDRSNYPFCTIDPNIGVVAVPDERVDKLSELTKATNKIFTTIEFVDIAGLIKGSHLGEGLGNKFLSYIRETDAIIYVLRIFLNDKIINTRPDVNPVQEKEVLDTELILKDLETLVKKIGDLESDVKSGKKEILKELGILNKAKDFLDNGGILFEKQWDEEDKEILKKYQLLTLKPRLYLFNGRYEEISTNVVRIFEENKWPFLIIDLLTEFEAADFKREERLLLNLPAESELDLLIKGSYKLLDLITFFTMVKSGEIRAWTLKKGQTAIEAGGIVHSDFQEHFIKADVINWKNLVDAGGFHPAREKGLIRTEGKEYIVQDGDVIEIKSNV